MVSKNKWTIELDDIYAEEQRNIPITIKLPRLSDPQVDWPIAFFEIQYSSPDSKSHKSEVSITINRPGKQTEGKSGKSENSIPLDEQRNRMLAAEALDQATRLGVNGQRSQAKTFLQGALSKIETSLSHSTPYSQSLVRDLKEAVSKMDSSDFNHVAAKYLYR